MAHKRLTPRLDIHRVTVASSAFRTKLLRDCMQTGFDPLAKVGDRQGQAKQPEPRHTPPVDVSAVLSGNWPLPRGYSIFQSVGQSVQRLPVAAK
jgi:hypothetical protein